MSKGRFLDLVLAALGSARVIFLVAFFIRVIIAIQLIPGHAERSFYFPNEPARIAWNLVSGRGYSSPWPHTVMAPTAQQPPVYPLLVAAIFRVFGAYTYLSLYIAVFLNAAFSAVTAVLILRLGEWAFGRRVGIVAALIWSCWIYEVVVSLRLWESALSGMLLALILWCLQALREEKKRSRWLWFGILAGIAALNNVTLLAVLGVLGMGNWVATHDRLRRRHLLASAAACALVLLPWTIRNYVKFDRVIPLRDNFGLELWAGNHQGVTHLSDFFGTFPLSNPGEYNRMGEIAFMENDRSIALNYIREDPKRFLRLCGERALDFWVSPTPKVWLPIAGLAWFGLAVAWRRRSAGAFPFAVVLGVFPLVYYITHTWSTYRHPIDPEILLLAAYGAAAVIRACNKRLGWNFALIKNGETRRTRE